MGVGLVQMKFVNWLLMMVLIVFMIFFSGLIGILKGILFIGLKMQISFMKSVNWKLIVEWQKFNSDEELYFLWLFRDFKKGGWIVGVQYELLLWVLIEWLDIFYQKQLKMKRKQEKLFMWFVYKYICDFKIVWKLEVESCLFWKFGGFYWKLLLFIVQDIDGRLIMFIEVKFVFDFNNMIWEVWIKVVMVYQFYGYVIQFVKVLNVFRDIFILKWFIWMDMGKQFCKIGGKCVIECKDYCMLEQLVNQMGGK